MAVIAPRNSVAIVNLWPAARNMQCGKLYARNFVFMCAYKFKSICLSVYDEIVYEYVVGRCYIQLKRLHIAIMAICRRNFFGHLYIAIVAIYRRILFSSFVCI